MPWQPERQSAIHRPSWGDPTQALPQAGSPTIPSRIVPLSVERDLVERAAGGEQEAMGALYNLYRTPVYRFCLARETNEPDAEDLASEVFLKVVEAIEGFEWRPIGTSESGRSPFAAWLFLIARNHLISFHRKAVTHGQTAELCESILDERRSPPELTEIKITIEEVFETVWKLSRGQRDVILLRFGWGFNVAETAEALGKEENNVKVQQNKGVRNLKKLLLESPDPVEPRLVDGVIVRTTTA